MAKNNETTTKFKVDISELKTAMQEAKKQVAYANSEFKAVSSSLDDWSKSSDGLNAKLKQLKSNLDSQETILSEYEKTLEEVKTQYGENSKEAREYATKLNNQQAVVNKIKKEIAGYEDALEEVSKAEKTATKTGKSVAEVLDDVGNEAEDAGDGFTTFKGAIATFVGNSLTSLVGGLRDAATSILGLAESTKEYRNQMAKLESASSEAGYTSTYTANKYKELYGVLEDETATTTTISNFMALEASGKTLDSLLNSSIGIWSKYGDSIPLDGLAEAINETAKVGTVTGGLADALNWAGVNEDEFNASLEKCSTEQERQQLIASTLDSLYGDLANSYKENNKSIIEANEAQAEYTETLATMGEKIEPVTTTLKTGFTDLLNTALKLFGDEVDIEAFTSKLEEGFKVLTDNVLPAVKDGLGWIKDNKDFIIAGLAGIAAGFVAFNVANMIMTVVTAIKGFTTGLTLAQVAMKALNLVIASNPIGLLVTIITTVVVAIGTFIATNDEARAKFLEIWGKIVEGAKNAINSIGKFFTETLPAFINKALEFFKQLPNKIWTQLASVITKVNTWKSQMLIKAREAALNFINKVIEFVSQLPAKIQTYLTNIITKITTWISNLKTKAKTAGTSFIDTVTLYVKQLPDKIQTYLTSVITKLSTWVTNLKTKAKTAATSFISTIVTNISQLPAKIQTYLTSVLTRLNTWISNMKTKGTDAIKGLIDKVIDGAKNLPTDMATIGKNIVDGIWTGIKNAKDKFFKDVKGFFSGLVDKAKEALDINSPSKTFAEEVGKWIPAGIAVGVDDNAKTALESVKNLALDTVGSARAGLSTATTTLGGNSTGGGRVVNNFTQVINSPKQLSRLDIYRQSKNLLGYAGGGI